MKDSDEDYRRYLLNTDDDIKQFLDALGFTPAETKHPIEINRVSPEIREKQAITEGNKKPDFLFPSEEAYHDKTFAVEKLCTLAAKTTCKDRWRQILNEADRLRDENKYLCTMQQGISATQMDEMQAEKVIFLVLKAYHSAYPKEKRERIWTLGMFVNYVKETEGSI